jgi:hypothetical protein
MELRQFPVHGLELIFKNADHIRCDTILHRTFFAQAKEESLVRHLFQKPGDLLEVLFQSVSHGLGCLEHHAEI